MDKKLNVIDLFSGCGGFSEGFLKTNHFSFLAHVEWELPMVQTLRNNLVKRHGYSEKHALETVIYFDIQKTEELIHGDWSSDLLDIYGKNNSSKVIQQGLNGILGDKTVDVIIGGPPCQAYSLVGRAQDKNSMKGDYRNYLFESFVKIVDFYKPKCFVFENVPGILSAKPKGELIIYEIISAFEKIGYKIRDLEGLKKSIFNSHDFGVAQDRKRVIIFGVLQEYSNKIDKFYELLETYKSNDKKNVIDVIKNLPKFKPLNKSYKQSNKNISHELIGKKYINLHNARYHNQRDIEIFKEWLKNDLNSFSTDEKIQFYYEKTGKKTKHIKYRNLYWDKPSPTIVSHLQKDGLMFIHPDINQLRSITVLEASLLQDFPIDYPFSGSESYCFKMIGNAVPVNLSKNIAHAVYDVFYKKPTKNILIACEESQTVCKEFRKLGFNAFSCDIQESSGGHPEWHFKEDIFKIIENRGGVLENGRTHYIDGEWDLMIAHPPCTYLAVSGARWYYHPDDKDLPLEERRPHPKYPNRAKDRKDAIEFFLKLANANIKHIAVENPIGIMSSEYKKPSQIVHPYFFGDKASKATCLWLKNLPLLEPTNMVEKGEFIELSSGKKIAKWYSDAFTKAKNEDERRRLRSKTFQGIAEAMAKQWSKDIE